MYTSRRGLVVGLGTPKVRFHKGLLPEYIFVASITFRPLRVTVFWKRKLIIWIGDREWKLALENA
jgi:hypothetical protein